ncbi:MAG: formylglycine-generating enzyme family protein [Sphingobacteriales bacterium]|nr:formylglycine-generating enzyme family protein [Sphingobacteriales bacterium]
MVEVEGGSFMMGSNEDSDEKPIHQVTLSSYQIAKYPLTQAQWQAVMHNNPSHWKGDNLPVGSVSWEDAQAFIKKLNAIMEKAGQPADFRLPTEAEWEYAARGGKYSKGYTYAGSNNLEQVGWYDIDNITCTVGQKQANELGLYDMSGNVWEWCQDWYDCNYYKISPTTNPTGPNSSSHRVLRGGSWESYLPDCRVANRDGSFPDRRAYYFGFRLAL